MKKTILHPLNNSNFILLAYLATDKAFQNHGIGNKFFSHILNSLTLSNQYLIIEVENPDVENKQRRINFYRKFGAKEMQNLKYILPPLSGETSTEMKLMILLEYPDHVISGDVVKKLIKQIYQEVYSLDENDYYLNSFIYDIDDSVVLA